MLNLSFIGIRGRLRDHHVRGIGLETGIDGCRSYRSCLGSGSFSGGYGRYLDHRRHVSGVVKEIWSRIWNGFYICFHHPWTAERHQGIESENATANQAGMCLIGDRIDQAGATRLVESRCGRRSQPLALPRLCHHDLLGEGL
ncbi:hypothetical protein QIS74_03441 [Colletotrichum tabaci]|uniref:Uncharacterized protein n=1 Tax=Colletotrichum tabaci TaxID=1209068 RepID=A0AAV9TP73_9PEZI